MTLAGEWWNELGSKLIINPSSSNPRLFDGSYHTAVGTAQQRDYALVGTCDNFGGTSQTVGWAVAFDPPDPPEPGKTPNGPTTCAWSGQLQVARGGLEYIVSTWILTGATERADNWTSTTVGKDYFFRSFPSPEMIGLAVLL